MTYREFERKIADMAISASEEARRRFAIDSIRILRQAAATAIHDELHGNEQQLVSELLFEIELESPDRLADAFKKLTDATSHDPVRAIEFSADITELFCAIGNWIEYRRSSNPQAIVRIAVSVVNSVDHAIGGDSGSYSIANILGDPRMSAEFDRQRRLLCSDRS